MREGGRVGGCYRMGRGEGEGREREGREGGAEGRERGGRGVRVQRVMLTIWLIHMCV